MNGPRAVLPGVPGESVDDGSGMPTGQAEDAALQDLLLGCGGVPVQSSRCPPTGRWPACTGASAPRTGGRCGVSSSADVPCRSVGPHQLRRRGTAGTGRGADPRRILGRVRGHGGGAVIGRSAELAVLRGAATSVGPEGVALVLEGPPGIGKSTLVDALAADLTVQGFRVLRCTGLEGDHGSGFAALHELLHPVLSQSGSLPERQGAALRAAFGMTDGVVPDRLLISLAALGLVEEAASDGPLLLLVEDAQWLDDSSLQVLSFVATRLSRAPVLMVFSVRDGIPGADPLRGHRLRRLTLGPLSPEEAAQLVGELHPELSGHSLRRVLDEAAGNPLALCEFAAGVAAHGVVEDRLLTPHLPTTRRVESAFLDGARALPDASRHLLLLAAASARPSMTEMFAAAGGVEAVEHDLGAVERAGLGSVVGDRFAFRHPLVRSAVYNAASSSERMRAHRALADVTTDPEQAAWHRSSATVDRDESVAVGMELAAESARRRGALAEAVAALRRAAALSEAPADRVRRLAVAAEVARQAGRVDDTSALLREALPLAEDPDVLALLVATEVLLDVTTSTPGRSAEEAVALASRIDDAHVLHRSAVLLGACARAWVMGAPASAFELLDRAARDLGDDGENWLALLCRGYTDPMAVAAPLRERLPRLVTAVTEETLPADVGESGVARWFFSVGLVAQATHDLDTASRAWDASLSLAQTAGAAGDEALTVAARGLTRVLRGDVRGAQADGEQAAHVATECGLRMVVGLGSAVTALSDALAGNAAAATAAVRRSRAAVARTPAALVVAAAHWAAGLVALDEGRSWDAFQELGAVSVHPALARWAIGDLVEAALRAGRAAEVEPRVAEGERAAEVLGSAHLLVLVHRARGLLAGGADAAGWYERSLAAAGTTGSPVERARTQLVYGEWLRRRRRITEARQQLESAAETFRAVGARALAERAEMELRAAGAGAQRGHPPTRGDLVGSLTAQELTIAQLAASGLTNQEIADQLYLSPRTVGYHLFKAFPKLNVTKRGQLGDALAGG